MATTEELLLRLVSAKELKAQAEADIEALTAELVPALKKVNPTKWKAAVRVDDDRVATGTVVESSVIEVDEGKLRRIIGATLFRKVTKPVLDKAKLDQAMADGVIDVRDVATASVEKPRKPYVKITWSKPK